MVDPRTKNAHENKGQTTPLKPIHFEQSISLPTDDIPLSQVLIEPLESTRLSNIHLTSDTSDTSDNDGCIRKTKIQLSFA